MRGAVAELSKALVSLFDMIRSDRSDQRARIAELEAELAAAQERIAVLDPQSVAAPAGPDPSDFDQLREAAERLRERTQELVQQAGTPADDADLDVESDLDFGDPPAADAEGHGLAGGGDLGAPGVLRIFPGALMEVAAGDLDVENDLDLDVEEPRRAVARGMQVADVERFDTPETGGSLAGGGLSTASRDGSSSDPAPGERAATARFSGLHAVPEPIELQPRPARKRRRSLRRRKIDARKLRGVDPSASLRAMVSAIPALWTAGCRIDLVVALTDGDALKIRGGDLVPLEVTSVESGTPAQATITATSAQVVPLFGRLELTDDQSPPMIHGQRRQADLLVGWIDRAQRLSAEPL
jgi:hypothetical protein